MTTMTPRSLLGSSIVGGLIVILAACGDDDVPLPADSGTDAGSDASTVCATAADCDNGAFCDGVETCAPGTTGANARGCVAAGTDPCTGGACDEAANACTSCGNADVDGDDADSIACGGTDCDDDDASRYPGATEICDSDDEDCNDTTYGPDGDGDTFVSVTCCNGVDNCGTDCNDALRGAYPGAIEVCNAVDEDCDGVVDDGAQVTVYTDADEDGYGTGAAQMQCADTAGFSVNATDCDDAEPLSNPSTPEVCDAIDNDCDGTVDDGATEVSWYVDTDGDGFGSATVDPVRSCVPVAGRVPRGGDCNDADRAVNPGAAERCNGRDDNCNGVADYRISAGNFEDDDGDGAADSACPGGAGTDCDDAEPSIGPAIPDFCGDGIDNNCNGTVDEAAGMSTWYLDADDDGWGDSASTPITSCTLQAGRSFRAGDCDDADSGVHPGQLDGCDGVDVDCDSAIDEDGVRYAYFTDADADGYGVGAAIFACVPPAGTSASAGDCNDAAATRHPSAMEDCNGIDDDCDGMVDEGATLLTFYTDVDRDGHGVATGPTRTACVASSGFAASSDDCDDADDTRFPGAVELCNGRDDNCDAVIDGPAANAACVIANGTGSCVVGLCEVASCGAGYGDCDFTDSTGCETDTSTSAANCGGCETPCAAADTCSTSVCSGSPVVQVAAGRNATCVRRANGRVACWSRFNNTGQLGDGTLSPGSGSPATVLSIDDAVDVFVSDWFVCAVRAGGTVWCWGTNYGGRFDSVGPMQNPAPGPIAGISDAVQVVATNAAACARRASGRVACWGSRGGAGGSSLGDGVTTGGTSATPMAVVGLNDALTLTSWLSDTMCAVRATGSVVCWGGSFGYAPATPAGLTGISNATSVAIAGVTVCARLADSTLACSRPAGTDVSPMPAPTGVDEIVAGYFHFCVRAGGAVSCWGANDVGQLGRGTTTASNLPAPVSSVSTATGLGHSFYHSTCTILASGSVRCWGLNDQSQLGDATIVNRSTPVLVLGL